ncbi:sterol desaturase family protein [Cyanobium sp. NIES-981]|uniref:sterol desaturase family protein n=1 Tax=Cyanobium sp. NIES-981 TaxID=1851505 RepID=UPI0007DE16CE|nr:sterol desaturase family protein [Cyanobium sp. NIES-981]SBO44877.1 Sterol desaturase family protein [Cyanobium sp. NIES-981]
MGPAPTEPVALLPGLGMHGIAEYGVSAFAIILARYFLVAGCVWWLLYARGGPQGGRSGDVRRPDRPGEIRRDIRLSVLSAVVFALATTALMTLHGLGLTRLYSQPQHYGWWYLPASYLAVLLLQDGFFYATHRLFHHPALYRWFHQGHHRSRQPTPWTSFAFDPLEAGVQALFLMALVLVVPLHLGTLLAVLSTMTVWAMVNHLGLDHLPLRFPHHWLGRWVIGPAHHSVHHRRQQVHYGLYFTFWDRVFGTQDAAYSERIRIGAPATPATAGPGHR